MFKRKTGTRPRRSINSAARRIWSHVAAATIPAASVSATAARSMAAAQGQTPRGEPSRGAGAARRGSHTGRKPYATIHSTGTNGLL